MRHFAVILFSFGLATCVQAQDNGTLEPADVLARSIPLNVRAPEETKIGSLTYLGGLLVQSHAKGFAGWSGLAVSADGSQFLAVSDRAYWWTGRLVYTDGMLTGIASSHMARVLDIYGDKLRTKTHRDAESLSIGPDGTAYVSFERNHRIKQFKPGDPSDLAYYATQPDKNIMVLGDMRKAPENNGVEAMAAFKDGSLMVLTQKYRDPRGHVYGWWRRDGKDIPIFYRTRSKYEPVAMDELPNGDLLVLERQYTKKLGVSANLCIVGQDQLKAEAVFDCAIIAQLAPPMNVDNFEAMAIRTAENGRTHIYILSDDNENPEQDTLLMMFELNR